MNYLGQDEMTEMMGIGYLGEVRRGPDGDLYQWVSGVDGLGNPFGFWKKIKRFARKVTKPVTRIAKKALQFVRKPWCIPLQAVPGSVKGIAKRVCRVVGKLSPLAHVPVVGSYYRGAAKLCKIAKGCGIAGLEDGLGDGTFALYEGLAEGDGLYGLNEDEVLYGLGQEDLTEMMGIGNLGEVRQGPDGGLYQWVEGIDGLGRRRRFWHCRHCMAIKKRLALRRRKMRLRAKQAVSAAGAPSLPQAKPAGLNGLGDLYQASDGSVYQMDGLGEDEELYGLAEDEDLYGIGAEDELYGLAEDEDLYGLSEEDDLYGIGEEDDLYGLGEEDELYGIGEEDELYGLAEGEDLDGYVHTSDGVNGLEAYVSDQPPGNRMFARPAQPVDTWKPLW